VFVLGRGSECVRDFPGALRHLSGSLSPTILAHSATNLSLVALFA